MSKTTFLIIILSFIAVILVVVALRPAEVSNKVRDNTQVSLQPTPSSADTLLYMTPNPVQLSGTTSSVDVMINSNKNNVTAVQLEIAYDPKVLTNVKLKAGTFLPSAMELLNVNDSKSGRVSYALAIPMAQNPVSGTGTVATLSFDKNPSASSSTTQTTITLLDKSLVTMAGEKNSVLKSTQGTTVLISTNKDNITQ